jgi:hypothetical protein
VAQFLLELHDDDDEVLELLVLLHLLEGFRESEELPCGWEWWSLDGGLPWETRLPELSEAFEFWFLDIVS